MDKKKLIAVLGILLLILIGSIWYIMFRDNGNKLVASGTIEATEVIVSSQAMGTVMMLEVDEGDSVAKNDILARIDDRALSAALKSAQARFKLASDNHKRSKELYGKNLISPQQFDASSSALEVAAAALDLARIQHENATIKAPISGTVLVKTIETGELAAVGSPILTLADLREVELKVYLPEKAIGKVALGQTVMVSVDSFPGQKFTGRVSYISEKAEFTPKSIQTKDERVTQVFGIKIQIDNADLKLKPGMPADAEFQWASR